MYDALVLGCTCWLFYVLSSLTCIPSTVDGGVDPGEVPFIHRQKEAWDRLVAEAATLRAQVVEARCHAEDAEMAFEELSTRSRR
jgi:hypothetical protein